MSAARGHDYRYADGRCTRTLEEWLDEIERHRAKGGRVRRIGGDLTAFDAHGRIVFEVYDRDELEARDATVNAHHGGTDPPVARADAGGMAAAARDAFEGATSP